MDHLDERMQAWLDEPAEFDFSRRGEHRFEGPQGQLFARLISYNGGPAVTGWGVIAGPHGLHQDEALYLLQLSAMVDGMCRMVEPEQHQKFWNTVFRMTPGPYRQFLNQEVQVALFGRTYATAEDGLDG